MPTKSIRFHRIRAFHALYNPSMRKGFANRQRCVPYLTKTRATMQTKNPISKKTLPKLPIQPAHRGRLGILGSFSRANPPTACRTGAYLGENLTHLNRPLSKYKQEIEEWGSQAPFRVHATPKHASMITSSVRNRHLRSIATAGNPIIPRSRPAEGPVRSNLWHDRYHRSIRSRIPNKA